MRIWLIWVVLAVIWALQAGAALVVHRGKAAAVLFGIAVLFAIIANIVRQRMLAEGRFKSR